MGTSWRKYLAELIGTFVLVFCGCGAAVALGCQGQLVNAAYIGTALAFGLSIVAMAYSIGNVSGCHVNPAVSLAMWIDGKLETKDLAGYIVAQCLGAIVAAAVLGSIVGFGGSLGSNALYNGDILISLTVEIVLTFIFVLAVMGATSKLGNSGMAGLAIGLSLVLVHLVGIHFTGTSVNPARSLTALFAGGEYLGALWVFIVAPLIGGALASLLWRVLEGEDESKVEKVVEEPEKPTEIVEEIEIADEKPVEEVAEVEEEEPEPVVEPEAELEPEPVEDEEAEATEPETEELETKPVDGE